MVDNTHKLVTTHPPPPPPPHGTQYRVTILCGDCVVLIGVSYMCYSPTIQTWAFFPARRAVEHSQTAVHFGVLVLEILPIRALALLVPWRTIGPISKMV